MMSRLSACAAIVSTICLTLACDVNVGKNGVSVDLAHGKASDTWSRTYHLTPGGQVEIVNVSGLLTASTATGPDVEVVATREARASTDDAAKQLLASATMVEQASADRVYVESRLERRRGIGSSVTVRIDVRVPAGLRLSLKTQDGGVRLEGVQGTISAESVNGPIIGRDVSGAVTAKTVNGAVRMEIAKIAGDSRYSTVNGAVELGLAPDLNASLEASVVNGSVVIDDAVALLKDESSPQRVVGRLNNSGPRIVAEATNGAVRVRSGRLDSIDRGRGRGRLNGPGSPPRS